MLLQYLRQENKKPTTLKLVAIGGSACPPAIIRAFEDDYGVEVRHAWGMTEMSPIGSTGSIKPLRRRPAARGAAGAQGQAGLGAVRRRNEDRRRREPRAAVGRQDASAGSRCAGVAVVKAYFKGEGGDILDENGFFDTGDVATIDANGYMQITDRAKDVIKSGGEWISSIDIENFAVGHPDVAEAAVIGVAHPKWDERPLLVVVPKEGRTPQTRGSARIPASRDRQMVDARRHAGGEGDPAHRDGQDQQAEAARNVQGLPAAGRMSRARRAERAASGDAGAVVDGAAPHRSGAQRNPGPIGNVSE